LLQVMLELMVETPPCVLDDFLPSPWKAMHYKYRKYVKGGSANLSAAWGCRVPIDDNSAFLGPTMKLVGMHGKPVYVHVAVSSSEVDNEPLHVVRMARYGWGGVGGGGGVFSCGPLWGFQQGLGLACDPNLKRTPCAMPY
jgi:hypothetical protein